MLCHSFLQLTGISVFCVQARRHATSGTKGLERNSCRVGRASWDPSDPRVAIGIRSSPIVSMVWFTSTSRRDQFAIQESDLPPYPRQLATSLILPVAYSGAIGSSVIRTGVSINARNRPGQQRRIHVGG